MMKIMTIVGARPQFIKAAAISRIVRAQYAGAVNEFIVHTGQHFDSNMSQVFFDELDIPMPKFNLEISGGNHGAMTGKMLEGIENILLREIPQWVLVYGDTNSTLAGVLAATKLHIPVAHVEAGLRSFNMRMPEEINRIVADRLSSLLFCPTQSAVHNLANEGIQQGVLNVGDVMYDVAKHYSNIASNQSQILSTMKIVPQQYALATCHRAENTDDRERLSQILEALVAISKDMPVVLPLHPRTRKLIHAFGLESNLTKLLITDPLPFLDMMALEQSAKIILTDSGGVQKEAFFYGTPCITMRDETEWVETVQMGWNCLTGANTARIIQAFNNFSITAPSPPISAPYGTGQASSLIMERILNH